MTLNARQERFVAEYLQDLNATQAAIRAGYSKRSAFVTGSRLLSNAKVHAAVAEAQVEQLERLAITASDITRRAWEIAQQDRGDRVAALALLAKRHPEFSEKHERIDVGKVRELAQRFGLDPVEVLAEAEAIVGNDRRGHR